MKQASTASASTKGNPKKHSTLGGPGEWVPKKARPAKFCQHWKNKGGPHLSHITNEHHKYNKESNSMAAAAGKPFKARKPFKKGGNKQLAYLTATVESLVKGGSWILQSIRSASIAMTHWAVIPIIREIGCHDMELGVDKHLKLD